MALIGCNERFEPYEIAAYCDNIQWSAKLPEYNLRCDMFFGKEQLSKILYKGIHFCNRTKSFYNRN